MSLYLVLKLVHILLFVFWLGTDMGTYYSSKFVVNPDLTPGQRSTALQILLGCDLGPKVAMPLALPTGVHMAYITGLIEISSAGMVVLWILCLMWLGLVLKIHFGKDKVMQGKLKTFDFWMRTVIIVILLGVAVYSLINPDFIKVSWICWKLIVLAFLIVCGLGIRLQLQKFTPAFVDMVTGNSKPDTENIITQRMNNCLPYVYGIWIGTILNAALGIHLIG